MNKNVFYTCITGKYEIPFENKCQKLPDFDYICFADTDIKSNFWEIRPMPKTPEGLSDVKKQRWVKINAHKVLPEYEFSVWVDGNIFMGGDMSAFLKNTVFNFPYSFFVGKHPERNCVYEEAKACINLKKDIKENINPQMEAYKKEGLPAHFALAQTCMLFRYHNREDCIKLMETWWAEMEKYGYRDQLSFPYAVWKNPDVKIGWMDKRIFCSAFFRRIPHNKQKKS